MIQSWMCSQNTLEFLRQWELEQNAELIHQGHTTSLTITPTLWVQGRMLLDFTSNREKAGV